MKLHRHTQSVGPFHRHRNVLAVPGRKFPRGIFWERVHGPAVVEPHRAGPAPSREPARRFHPCYFAGNAVPGRLQPAEGTALGHGQRLHAQANPQNRNSAVRIGQGLQQNPRRFRKTGTGGNHQGVGLAHPVQGTGVVVSNHGPRRVDFPQGVRQIVGKRVVVVQQHPHAAKVPHRELPS